MPIRHKEREQKREMKTPAPRTSQPKRTKRRPHDGDRHQDVHRKQHLANSKVEEEEEEIPEQRMEMCRSDPQHNRNQREPTIFNPTQKTTTQPTHRDATAKPTTWSQSRWSRKSTRSLTSDDRIHELIQELKELKDSHWDFTINETWRARKEQLWRTSEGHTWASKEGAKHALNSNHHQTKHTKEEQDSGPRTTRSHHQEK